MTLNTRSDFFINPTQIDTTQIYRTSRLVSTLTGIDVPPNKAIVGVNAFAHESGIHQHGVLEEKTTYEIIKPETIGLSANRLVLGKHSGRHAFKEKIKEMGYNLEDSEIEKAFKKFKDLADKKKEITEKDIEALIEEEVIAVPETFKLEYLQATSGSGVVASAVLKLNKNGVIIEEAACGEGPVDAVYKAIDRACGGNFKLIDYTIKAVTGGMDALGEVVVRVENNGKVQIGRGVSTDIIEASAKAYLSAINKIAYKPDSVKEKSIKVI
ncbi:MAG TPA: 2-isopropylmalate synthase, partial [Thermoanaerobacterales bacterium]|nr:2-isopropylmalate synthase [Thermoanaerobacterales bacterium]